MDSKDDFALFFTLEDPNLSDDNNKKILDAFSSLSTEGKRFIAADGGLLLSTVLENSIQFGYYNITNEVLDNFHSLPLENKANIIRRGENNLPLLLLSSAHLGKAAIIQSLPAICKNAFKDKKKLRAAIEEPLFTDPLQKPHAALRLAFLSGDKTTWEAVLKLYKKAYNPDTTYMIFMLDALKTNNYILIKDISNHGTSEAFNTVYNLYKDTASLSDQGVYRYYIFNINPNTITEEAVLNFSSVSNKRSFEKRISKNEDSVCQLLKICPNKMEIFGTEDITEIKKKLPTKLQEKIIREEYPQYCDQILAVRALTPFRKKNTGSEPLDHNVSFCNMLLTAKGIFSEKFSKTQDIHQNSPIAQLPPEILLHIASYVIDRSIIPKATSGYFAAQLLIRRFSMLEKDQKNPELTASYVAKLAAEEKSARNSIIEAQPEKQPTKLVRSR